MKILKQTIRNLKLLSVSLVLFTMGCASQVTSFENEVKYGHLYVLQDALEIASSNCKNQTALSRANDLAKIGIVTIRSHGGTFKKGSAEYVKAIMAVNKLALVSRNNCKCNDVKDAYNALDQFMVQVSG